jgi:hypothetical protein
MHATIVSMHQSYLKSLILDVFVTDKHYLQVKESLQQEDVQQKMKEYDMKEDGLLIHKNRLYVPSSRELTNLVLKEMHNVPYAKHLGYLKTITVLKR